MSSVGEAMRPKKIFGGCHITSSEEKLILNVDNMHFGLMWNGWFWPRVFSSHGNWGLIVACARAALSNQLSKKETFSLFNFPSLLAISVRATEIEEPVDDMGRIDMISQLYILAQIMFTWDFNNSENLQQSEDRNVKLLSCFSFILILI